MEKERNCHENRNQNAIPKNKEEKTIMVKMVEAVVIEI